MQTDIAVVGGGLAGSLAAAMLGRAGHSVCIIAPNDRFPPEFRCEKLEEDHIKRLEETGLASAVIQAGTYIETLWIARFGRLIDKMPLRQYAMNYDTMVNAIREQIPCSVKQFRSWADAIETSSDRQVIRLSDGQQIDSRLVIVASGLNWSLRETLGVKRDLVSGCHSVALGFDLRREDGSDFDFPALQYFPEKVSSGLAYLTLFRINRTMRANLFVYLPLKSPLITAFRRDPSAALRALVPKLSRMIGSYIVDGSVKIRPTDLHALQNFEQAGVVLVGDAFATPCPVTGTGTIKVFNDVERLCNHHIPGWLSTPGMDIDKIQNYYLDQNKIEYDALSAERAYSARSLATSKAIFWRLQRLSRFLNRLLRWGIRSTRRQLVPDRIHGETRPLPSLTAPPS